MPTTRDKRRPYWLARYDASRGRMGAPTAIEARDVPSAWRRAERECKGSSFALYDPDGKRVRVGVTPPPALPTPLAATAIALSADGELVITGHDGGALRVHDAGTGELRWERFVGASRIDCVVVPRRAPWFVVCSRAGEVWVLDSNTGDTILHLADDEARDLALTPDDRTLALAGAVVELWSLPNGARIASLDLDVATAAARSAGGDDEIHEDEPEPDDSVHVVGFAAKGARVVGARARGGGELILWDRASARRIAARGPFPVNRMAITRDGTRAVIGANEDGAVARVVDLGTLETLAVHTTGAEGLCDVRLTPDDRHALLHDDETGIYVVDMATGATHAWLDELEACAYAVGRARAESARRRNSNGRVASSMSSNPDETQVVALPRWRRGDPGAPLSSDGRRYAALRQQHDEGMVALFDLTTCLPYAALSHAERVEAVWLNRDGTRAVTRDARGRVFVWTLPDAPERLTRLPSER